MRLRTRVLPQCRQLAIAALAAGLVLAYNKLKPFYGAVNTTFVLLKARA